MTGKGSKDKGKRYERHVSDKINEKFNSNARRTPNSGALGEIPEFQGDIMQLPPELQDFIVECKHQERLEIWRFLNQAEKETPSHKIPLLVFTKNNKPDYVTLKLDTFLDIIKQLHAWTGD